MTQSAMTFPCDFQLKIIGKQNETFMTTVMSIVRQHFPDTTESAVEHRPSKKNNYIAIRVTVHAKDQASLDALYIELTQHPDILMVL